MISAEQEGITPEKLIARVKNSHEADFEVFDVNYDNYYTTHSEENKLYSNKIYLALRERGMSHTLSLRQNLDMYKSANKHREIMMIDAQLSESIESSNDFGEAYTRIMRAAPTQGSNKIYKASRIDTKLGPMIAIADEDALYLLEFVDRRALEREVERFRQKTKVGIIPGTTEPIDTIKNELELYFAGKLNLFQTPIKTLGSPFQERVWKTLQQIPYGETRSYLDIAKAIDQPTACRAVARANGTNQLAIIIPCHRVINSNGDIGGYGGGVARKQASLQIETSKQK